MKRLLVTFGHRIQINSNNQRLCNFQFYYIIKAAYLIKHVKFLLI